MPTAYLKAENFSPTPSDDATIAELLQQQDLTESSISQNDPLIQVVTTQRTNQSIEARNSKIKIQMKNDSIRGKTTRSFELRRKANLVKAREMDVKMANHKKNSDLPLSSTIKEDNTKINNPNTVLIADGVKKKSPRERSPILQRLTPKTPPKTLHILPTKTPTKSPVKTIASRAAGGGGGGNISNRSKEIVVSPPEQREKRQKHVECQASDSDINNWQILADCKIMRPSPAIWGAILKKREEELRRVMLKEERFVPEHSKAEANYQTNLKEFLETGTVKHYEREETPIEPKKVKSSRSEELKRLLTYKPKPQPEMDLKKRLPKIEEELLTVFKGRAKT